MPDCMCGCGEDVPRRFRPGHDARMKSRLFAAAREGDAGAKAQIVEMGWWHLYDKTAPKPNPLEGAATIKAKAAAVRAAAREARCEPDPEYPIAARAAKQAAETAKATAYLTELNLRRQAATVLREAFPDRTQRPKGIMVGPLDAERILHIGPDPARLAAAWDDHLAEVGRADVAS